MLFSPGSYVHRMAFCVTLLLFIATGCNLNTPETEGVSAIQGVPVVRIIAPLPNAPYRDGVNVPIQAQISNAGPDIDRVEVSVDGSIIQTFTTPNSNGNPIFSITYTWAASGPGAHTIDVVAFRQDGSSSAPVPVTITVVSQSAVETPEVRPTGGSVGQTPSGVQQATRTPQQSQPSNTPQPTAVPASATPNTPQVTTRQGINVRSGPGLNFNPPIGSLASGSVAPLVARSPAGDWYKIRYYNGEGWVFANLVDVSGDITSLPIDPGPPTPIPPTTAPILPTAVPATAVPASSANLVAGNWRLDPPGDPVCAQTFNIFLDVANLGSTATTAGGTIDVRDVRVADNSPQGSTVGGFPVIQAGQTVNVGPIPLTVSTYYGEQHKLILTINPGGVVPETSTADNVREITYTLQKGSCP
jgi:hypothetical protein